MAHAPISFSVFFFFYMYPFPKRYFGSVGMMNPGIQDRNIKPRKWVAFASSWMWSLEIHDLINCSHFIIFCVCFKDYKTMT